MNKPKFFVFLFIFLFSFRAVFAQTPDQVRFDPSYEVLLNVVVASNNSAAKGKLPPSLSGVAGRLKNDYLFSNYNLAATFLERISSNGIVGHSGILNQLDQAQQNNIYFSDWGLNGLKAGKDEKGNQLIHFEAFNFGAKVPVIVETNAKGDGRQVVNYENIGLRINRFNLPANTPTIIGSLATPKTDEFIFLILTVRPV
ncbi:MAG: hypothetical protein ABIP06_08530 [Pyrinomonadaceae bacterium]